MKKILTNTLILVAFLGCEKENIKEIDIKSRTEIDCNADVSLITQEDLENFNCETVNGRLNVGAGNGEPLEIREYHFRSLKSVKDDLRLKNIKKIDNLSFDNLTELKGDLTIINNHFNQFNAFNSLESIEGGIGISKNENLVNIRGFYSLSRVSGYLDIFNNNSLKYIDAFNVLLDIESYSTISYNENLIEITGFNSLKTIKRANRNGGLSILGNPNLTYISGYDDLEVVTSGFSIKYNPNLNCKDLCKFVDKAGNGQYDIHDNQCENYEQVKEICS